MTKNRNKSRTSLDKQADPEHVACVHLEKSITPTKVKNIPPHAVYGRCSECTNKDKIQLCLKCGRQFCTPHSDIHSERTNNHALTCDLTTLTVYCSVCKKEVPHDCHSAVTKVVHIVEDYLKKQNGQKVGPAPKIVISSPTKDTKVDVLEKNMNTAVQETFVIEPQLKGLKNTGVICFFNSVLQNLIQTPMLRACLHSVLGGYTEVIHSKLCGDVEIEVGCEAKSFAMMQKYQDFLKRQDSKDRSRTLYPSQVFQEMCTYNECLSYGQQDAHEAYHSLIHSMNTEEGKRRKNAVLATFECDKSTFKGMTREKKKKIQEFANLARNETFIDLLFRGSTLTHITCLTCHIVTTIKDHFVDLSVPLPKKEDIKTRRKQKSSGEQGMSKHQKKKQARENRKKGKKNNQKDKKENTHENGEHHQNGGSSQHVLENGLEVEDVNIDDIKIDIDDEEDDIVIEDVTIELEEMPEHIVMETVELVDETPSDTEETLDEKLAELAAEINTNPCLRGGHGVDSEGVFNGVSDEEDEDEGGMLCDLFREDEDSPTTPVTPVTELTTLFEDLDIDTTSYGTDSLDACFAQFCREELLTDDNQFKCLNCAKRSCDMRDSLNVSMAKCSDSSFSEEEDESEEEEEEEKIKPVKRDARVRTYLNYLPPILVIHLKRFTQDTRGHLQKDRRNIIYPVELNLDDFVSSKSNVGNNYKLYGVVDHSGSLNRGHYIAFVRKRNTKIDEYFLNDSVPLQAHIKLLGQINSEITNSNIDKWYCCNDERISEVPLKKVLNADAYLLFYERSGPYSSNEI